MDLFRDSILPSPTDTRHGAGVLTLSAHGADSLTNNRSVITYD
jgi:hypothetical protein